MFPQQPDPNGVILLHAAAIETQGGAAIFLGPSGIGKSTLCAHVENYTSILADDKIYLIPRNGHWVVADATTQSFLDPLRSRKVAGLCGLPLCAIFRLYQATVSSIEPLQPQETCRYLTHSFFEIFWHKDWSIEAKAAMFSALARVALAIPGYRFRTTLSQDLSKLLDRFVSFSQK
mgnify:CR=1 FL=1